MKQREAELKIREYNPNWNKYVCNACGHTTNTYDGMSRHIDKMIRKSTGDEKHIEYLKDWMNR